MLSDLIWSNLFKRFLQSCSSTKRLLPVKICPHFPRQNQLPKKSKTLLLRKKSCLNTWHRQVRIFVNDLWIYWCAFAKKYWQNYLWIRNIISLSRSSQLRIWPWVSFTFFLIPKSKVAEQEDREDLPHQIQFPLSKVSNQIKVILENNIFGENTLNKYQQLLRGPKNRNGRTGSQRNQMYY